MDNFSDFENKSYAKAEKLDYKINDHIQFFLKTTGKLIKIYLFLIYELFTRLFKVFSPAKPKNIAGQLALVTGVQRYTWVRLGEDLLIQLMVCL